MRLTTCALLLAVGLARSIGAAAQEPPEADAPRAGLLGLQGVHTIFTLATGGSEQYDDETRTVIERVTAGSLAARLEDLGVSAQEDGHRLECSFRFERASELEVAWSYRVSVRRPRDATVLWETEGEALAPPGVFASVPKPVALRACLGEFRAVYEAANPPTHGLELISELGSRTPYREFGVAAVAGVRFYLARHNPPRRPGAETSLGGIRVLDFPSAGAPPRATDIDLPELSGVGSLEVGPPLAYVLSRGPDLSWGLKIIDLSDRSAPTRLGSYEADPPLGSWTSLSVAGSVAAFSHSRGTPGNRNVTVEVQLVDVADPSEPRALGLVSLPAASDNVGDLEVAGTLVLVAARQSGLYLFDAAEATAPVLLANYMPGLWSRGVVVNGAHAYLSVSATRNLSSIHVLDISDPRNPRLVREVDTRGPAQRMALMDDRLYVADHTSGLKVYDVSTPATPTLMGQYLPDDLTGSVAITEVVAADGLLAMWGPSGPIWLLRARS